MTTDLTPFARLKLHIERHKYTKGRHAGDAPADTSRRAKTHFRVVQRTPERIDIIFHHTSILRTSADSPNIVLDSGGWHESPTTREALRDAVFLATQARGVYFHSDTRNGYTQTAVKGYVFYDGMEFDQNFNLVSPPMPFKAYRADREANKQVQELAKPYRAVLPVLHTAGPLTGTPHYEACRAWHDLRHRGAYNEKDRVLLAMQTPELWPLLTQLYWQETHQQTWQSIYRKITAGNRIVVEV